MLLSAYAGAVEHIVNIAQAAASARGIRIFQTLSYVIETAVNQRFPRDVHCGYDTKSYIASMIRHDHCFKVLGFDLI